MVCSVLLEHFIHDLYLFTWELMNDMTCENISLA